MLEVEGQESREETTRRLVETNVGHNQSPPKDRLEILDLLINANRGIEGGGGRFVPIKPQTYSGKRKSLALIRWVHEVEHFLQQSGISQNQWTISVTNFLEGSALNWYLVKENTYHFMGWQAFTTRMRQYFMPPNETTRLMDEWRKLRQGEGSLSTSIDNSC